MWFDYFRIESGRLCLCVLLVSARSRRVFRVFSPALHCGRFVCKALKASCSHAVRSMLIKELLQHMGHDISSHACQT